MFSKKSWTNIFLLGNWIIKNHIFMIPILISNGSKFYNCSYWLSVGDLHPRILLVWTLSYSSLIKCKKASPTSQRGSAPSTSWSRCHCGQTGGSRSYWIFLDRSVHQGILPGCTLYRSITESCSAGPWWWWPSGPPPWARPGLPSSGSRLTSYTSSSYRSRNTRQTKTG